MTAQTSDDVTIESTPKGSWVRVSADGSRSGLFGSREAAERNGKPAPKVPAAEQLVALASQRYSFGRGQAGEPYAVERTGPYLARMLRGGGHSLRAELAATYVQCTGKVPSSSALADAMTAIEGMCLRYEPETLHLRVAEERPGVIWLDLGHADGMLVELAEDGWDLIHPAEGPLFRRTDLTGPLPEPADGGDLDELRALVNVGDRDWPLLLGWLVAALIPSIPHPIALLTGEQGTGKTTAGRLLVNLVDPSAVPLRSGPRDEQGWGVAAAASWVVGIDNVSSIAPWLSDAMCRAVTGDGVATRRLYSDSDLSVLAFQRVLLLTSIDAGALRGDLAERLLTVELERIAPHQRRTDREVAEDYARAHPRILGALLNLTCEVLAALPAIRASMTDRPRMADFAEVLAALDKVRGTDSLGEYLRSAQRLSQDVVDNDPVGAAVRELMQHQEQWRGPAKTLLEELTRLAPQGVKHWPGSPRALSGRLRQLSPALRSSGIDVDDGRTKSGRFLTLTKTAEEAPQ